MEKMLVVVFDNESRAYEGSHILKQLDAEGSITIHAESVIKKNADGTVTLERSEDGFPVRTAAGTAIGSLIGMLGEPVGLGIGGTTVIPAGRIEDFNVAGLEAEFLEKVAIALTPGKYAIVSDLSEEWIAPIDTAMETLGGTVNRAARNNFEADLRAKDVAAIRAEIRQVKIEHAHAFADRKATLQAKIDELTANLQAKLVEAEKRSKQLRSETEAKVRALQKKAEKAPGGISVTLEARAKRIQEDYEKLAAKLTHLLATQLKEPTASLVK
jgi:uncharacterized membrane protein